MYLNMSSNVMHAMPRRGQRIAAQKIGQLYAFKIVFLIVQYIWYMPFAEKLLSIADSTVFIVGRNIALISWWWRMHQVSNIFTFIAGERNILP